ncbi:hypothetical protein [uncultured Herbaspirillum sp.]|uniref:hypothetical protein n=1 Tax=uncultured Herbaspirillum sp. TaxID=160236 RepID=UPI002587C978|nr:hypothetical protein [uncultured Herbaspirillum sp.]
MTITVLNLTEASSLLRTISKRDIKDVRAIDLDLVLVLENGHKIIISRGAVSAVNTPQVQLEFADGDVALGEVFEKLNHIEVPADAALTVTSKEITRYGIKRVAKGEADKKDKDVEDAPLKLELDAGKPTEALASAAGKSGGSVSEQADAGSAARTPSSFSSPSLADPGATTSNDTGGSISWPVVGGGLALLAAAGGGGGGGGGGGAAAASNPGNNAANTAPPAPPAPPATLSGATALGPLNNATITAYDGQGRIIGKAVPVIDGRYSLVLDQPGYNGLLLLVVRDNTPGVADNFADEATMRITDLGNTVRPCSRCSSRSSTACRPQRSPARPRSKPWARAWPS